MKREENCQACGLRQRRDFTSKTIELTITTHCVDFYACEQFVIPVESKLQKRSNRHDTRGITPKHAVSGEAHLCSCATQFRTPKKETSQQWRASHTDETRHLGADIWARNTFKRIFNQLFVSFFF